MKIRRYYGFDCDSVNGFNNGYYIDSNPIEVKDYKEAHKKCVEIILENWKCSKKDISDDNSSDYPIVELITGFFNDNGSNISESEYEELTERDEFAASYSYVYVSAIIIED